MRLRHATLAVAVLTVLSVAGCGDDSADPGTPPTEGTSAAKPPKKGGGAAQMPAGKPAATP